MSICKVLDRRGEAFFIGAPFSGRASKSDGRQNGDFADSADGFGSCPVEFDARRVRPLAVNHGEPQIYDLRNVLAELRVTPIAFPHQSLASATWLAKIQWQPIGRCHTPRLTRCVLRRQMLST